MTGKPIALKALIAGLGSSVTAIAVALLLAQGVWATPRYQVLHAFSGTDGAGVWDSVVFDGRGNLYGTTSGGGEFQYGTVFKLTPHKNGVWTESVLHSFNFHQEGAAPTGGLIFGPSGALYGTAPFGGAHGGGSVFQMTLGPKGWTETLLYSFGARSNDAYAPYAGVVMDGQGNLYGTGHSVFELQPGSDHWNEKVIHRFTGPLDGGGPFAGLMVDATGNLYGTTEGGGAYNGGTVYEVERTATGWKEKVLHSFAVNYKDGHTPGVGALTMDGSGNLYGTTAGGGCCGGVVFKLTPGSDRRWKETILYEFQGGTSGFEAGAGVVMDKAGNLYGTTIAGGSTSCGCGVVYKLAPAKGKWKYTVLHTFYGVDGAQPDANLILDSKGNLYGTTATGGPHGGGVVFELTP